MKELMIALQTAPDAAHGQQTPLYEQIYLAIRRDIEDGRLPRGEKLPSTRLLAANLNVSRFTVNLAYEQLVSEGYLQARAGSGFFVCDLSDLYDGLTRDVRPAQEPEVYAGRPGIVPEQTIRIDFSPFSVDAEHFPYRSWKRCSKEVLDHTDDLLLAREAEGDYALRETIATYLYRARGVNCAPEQILVGAGNEYLLMLVVQLLGAKKAVVMDDPTYIQAYEVLTHAGYQVLAGASDRNGLLCDTAQMSRADIAYVMPSHQFPMGTVMPLARRQELLDWAARQPGRYILEDDHDSEFRYIGKPIPSLQSRDRRDCVIYFGTFSKSISPALRMSYMVLPRHLGELFHAQFGSYSSTVSTQQQLTVNCFMKTGDFERHLNRMRRVYKAKHDYLLRELKHRSWVESIHGENAGLHLVVTVRTAMSEEELLNQALHRGVQLYGLGGYRINKEQQPDHSCVTLLFGFGGLTEEQISEGLDILDELLKS